MNSGPFIGGLDYGAFLTMPLDARIRVAASTFLGWRYAGPVRFPAAREGFPALVSEGPASIDCSSFTAWVLATAFPAPWIKWRAQHYADLQIFDVSRPWSPIEAVEALGIGARISTPAAGLWHLTQAWQDARTDDGSGLYGGHARLARGVEVLPDGDVRLEVLESSSRGDVGPRRSFTTWRALGRKYRAGVRAAALGPG